MEPSSTALRLRVTAAAAAFESGDLPEVSVHLGQCTEAGIRRQEGLLRGDPRRALRPAVWLLWLEQDVGALRGVRSSVEALVSVGALVERMGCHRIPDRCFHVRGAPMPLCARCLGVGIGQLIGFALYLAGVRVSLAACVAGTLLMLIDWGAQEYLGRMSTNPRRLVTGVLAGSGLGTLYCHALVLGWRLVT